MTAPADPHVWWLVPIPGVVCSLFMFLAMWFLFRKRRWRDFGILSKAASMPPEHVAQEPKEVRDLQTGEAGWVSSSSIVTSTKNNRVFLAWTATLQAAPTNPGSDFEPLRIVRLQRGFSLALRPGLEFRTSPLPWGYYAPVIEMTQEAPGIIELAGDRTGG